MDKPNPINKATDTLYKVVDAVNYLLDNGMDSGGVPAILSGPDESRPTTPEDGTVFISHTNSLIYQYRVNEWVQVGGNDIVDWSKLINIPAAGPAVGGVLTSADWNRFDAKEDAANKGKANGFAGLDSNGKVQLNQLPALDFNRTYVYPDESGKWELIDSGNLRVGDRLIVMESEAGSREGYIWDGTAWHKDSDTNWANVNLSWYNIYDRPNVLTNEIEDAVGHAKIVAGNPHNTTKAHLGLDKVQNKNSVDIIGEIRLVTNYKGPTAAYGDFNFGVSIFDFNNVSSTVGTAWANLIKNNAVVSHGTQADSGIVTGFVKTYRTTTACYQIITERLETGATASTSTGYRQFKRVYSMSLGFWQPLVEIVDANSLKSALKSGSSLVNVLPNDYLQPTAGPFDMPVGTFVCALTGGGAQEWASYLYVDVESFMPTQVKMHHDGAGVAMQEVYGLGNWSDPTNSFLVSWVRVSTMWGGWTPWAPSETTYGAQAKVDALKSILIDNRKPNLVPNSCGEFGLAGGWAATGVTASSWQTGMHPTLGTVMQHKAVVATSPTSLTSFSMIPVVQFEDYTFSFMAKLSAGNYFQVMVKSSTDNTVLLSRTVYPQDWGLISGVFTVPGGTTSVKIEINIPQGEGANERSITRIMLSRSVNDAPWNDDANDFYLFQYANDIKSKWAQSLVDRGVTGQTAGSSASSLAANTARLYGVNDTIDANGAKPQKIPVTSPMTNTNTALFTPDGLATAVKSIAVDDYGNIYVAASTNASAFCVFKLDSNGNTIWRKNGYSNISQIVCNKQMVAFVCNNSKISNYGAVLLNAADGSVVFQRNENYAITVALDDYNNTIIGSSDGLIRVRPDNNVSWTVTSHVPSRVAVDNMGNVYSMAQSGSFYRYTQTGSLMNVFALTSYPASDMSVADQGYVYASFSTHPTTSLMRFVPENGGGGAIWTRTVSGAEAISGIAVDRSGVLYATKEVAASNLVSLITYDPVTNTSSDRVLGTGIRSVAVDRYSNIYAGTTAWRVNVYSTTNYKITKLRL